MFYIFKFRYNIAVFVMKIQFINPNFYLSVSSLFSFGCPDQNLASTLLNTPPNLCTKKSGVS